MWNEHIMFALNSLTNLHPKKQKIQRADIFRASPTARENEDLNVQGNEYFLLLQYFSFSKELSLFCVFPKTELKRKEVLTF